MLIVQVFLITFAVFALAMFGLALGWLVNQKTLKGSCGGVSTIPGMEDHQCACSKPCEKRRQRMAAQQEKEEKTIEFRF